MERMKNSFPYLRIKVRMNRIGRMKHSFIFIFPQNFKFSFPKNWKELEGIEFDLMKFFIKTSKIPLYIYSTLLF